MCSGRLRPVTPSQLSHAIVTVLTREQEDFIEMMTKDVWQLEQRLTGGNIGDPEKYLEELFRARHGLLAVRTMGAQSGAIYHSMNTLTGISTEGRQLVADNAQQFERVRSLADGETEYLHGVIEFYQTVLSVKSTLLGQAQNEKVQLLTEASYAQNEEIKKDLRMGRDLLRPHAHWHRLRHELRTHARAALGHRLSSRAARNGADVSRPVLNVPTAQVALNGHGNGPAPLGVCRHAHRRCSSMKRHVSPYGPLIITAVTVDGKTGVGVACDFDVRTPASPVPRRGDVGTVGQSVKAGFGLSARRR
jgi:hypothetical protein